MPELARMAGDVALLRGAGCGTLPATWILNGRTAL